MPNGNISLAAGEWTELTSGNASSITFQNICSDHILVQATSIFPGVASASRVWALSGSKAEVFVSHA